MLEIKQVDRDFYRSFISDHLPDKIYDSHVHIWTPAHVKPSDTPDGTALWASNYLKGNIMPYSLLQQAYEAIFPDRWVVPLVFGMVKNNIDVPANNIYVGHQAKEHGIQGLAVSKPEYDLERLINEVEGNGLIGLKPYPNFAPSSIPANEVRITDMVTRDQLELADERGWVLLLHIPRSGRIADQANIEDLMMIDREYKNIRLIVAHIGRAYCVENIGEAFDILKHSENMMFDIAGHTNEQVFAETLKTFGAKRIMFGSDFPIGYMRLHREHVNGTYINEISAGSLGDVLQDNHIREINGADAESISLFVYESIASMIRAVKKLNLPDEALDDIFYRNAKNLLT